VFSVIRAAQREDIIDIVVQQPASVGFICRIFYNFFVSRRGACAGLADRIAARSEGDSTHWLGRSVIRSSTCASHSGCRVLFNSDSFKNPRFST